MNRQALLEEYDTVIAPHKTALANVIPSLLSRYYSPPPGLPTNNRQGSAAAGVAKSIKRQAAAGEGGGAGGGPANKRSRNGPGPPLDEAERQLQDIMRDVRQLITRRLWGKKECLPFKEPVDPVKLNIPDYHNYVKYPMDVGTVRKKLEQGQYRTPLEVRDDLRLVWRNCATYNPPGHVVRKSGDILAAAWENAWAESGMEARWNEYALQRDPKVSLSVC